MNLSPLYHSSSFVSKLMKQKKNNPTKLPLCVFSDLDDTYLFKYWPSEEILDNEPQKITDIILNPDVSIYNPTIALKKLLDSYDIPLVIVSGRDLYQMNELRNKFIQILPEHPEIMDFDAIIGAVGTEIYVKQENKYEQDSKYELLCAATNYNKPILYDILEDLILPIRNEYEPVAFDFCKRDQKNNSNELPTLPYKISYEFKSDENTAHRIIEKIRSTLNEKGFSSVKILWSNPYSINESTNKYNVDIVPFSKEKPINYLKDMLNLKTIVAGDSGNDYEMLADAADIGIIVGNAKKELIVKMNSFLESSHKNSIYLMKEEGPHAILKIITKIVSSYETHN